MRANTGFAPPFTNVTNCGGTLATIALLLVVDVVESLVTKDAFINARSSVDLLTC